MINRAILFNLPIHLEASIHTKNDKSSKDPITSKSIAKGKNGEKSSVLPILFFSQKKIQGKDNIGSKKVNTVGTSELCKKTIEEYKEDIRLDLIGREEEKKYNARYCLKNHDIEPSLRKRMVDWMLEVFAVFHCEYQTFFKAVTIMDLFYTSTFK